MKRWLTALVFAAVAPAHAQPAGEPLGVRFRSVVTPADETVRATVTYRLSLDRGTERIPLIGLHFLGARVEGLEASLDGERLELEGRERAGEIPVITVRDLPGTDPPDGGRDGPRSVGTRESALFAGDLRLPRAVEGTGEHELTLTYDVVDALRSRGNDFDLVVPVIIVDWPPTTAPPDMFRARIEMPSDFSVAAAFPTVDRVSEERDGTRLESFQLQVTPSVLRFRGSVGEAPLFTRGRLVDLGVGLFLLGLVAYGMVRWRRGLLAAEAP